MDLFNLGRLAELEKQVANLTAENSSLKSDLEIVEAENFGLREKLGMNTSGPYIIKNQKFRITDRRSGRGQSVQNLNGPTVASKRPRIRSFYADRPASTQRQFAHENDDSLLEDVAAVALATELVVEAVESFDECNADSE